MEQILATCNGAFVTTDTASSQWTIGNDAIRKTLVWQEGAGLFLAALEQRATGHAWRPALQTNALAGGEFSLSWNGATLSARQATALQVRVPKRTLTPSRCKLTCAWRRHWMSACATACVAAPQ